MPMTILAAIVLVVLIVSTCFAFMPTCISKADDGIPEMEEGSLRVQILSDSVIRVEKARSDGTFCDDDTLQVVGRGEFEGADFKTSEVDGKLVITVGDYSLFVPKGATSHSGVYLTDKEGETLWKYTGREDNSGELPSPSTTPMVHVVNDSPRIIAPSWGYTDVGSEDPYNGYKIENNTKDLYIFIPEKNSKKLLSDYVALTGRTNMLPLSALGLWNSRYYRYTAETVKEQVAEYEQYGVPLDNFVIDTDWNDASDVYENKVGGYGTGYGIDKECFPDMEGFLKWMHDNDLFVMFNDHPRMVDGTSQPFDPVDVKYRSEGLNSLLDIGADAWWYDRNWYVSISSPTPELNKEVIGMYLYYYVTDQHYADIAKKNGDAYARRSLVMTNVDNINNGVYYGIDSMASHRYGFQWTGDISASEKGLAQEIENVVKAGKNSLPYVSSDLGGHNGQPATDLYIRWMQYGALSPIYRTHSANSANYQRLPWLFGEQALEVVRNYIQMRYRLLPLYYSLSHENYMTGLPLTRSLEFDYPQYEESKRNDEYLLGENILVAPMSGDYAAKDEDFKDITISYFNNTTMSGKPYAVHKANAINFNWGNGAPVDGYNHDNFSAIVEGKFTPQSDGRYSIVSDDGCRVYIDGVCVVDHWTGSDSEKFDFGIDFKAGRVYDIKVEYYEGGGGASLVVMKAANNSRDVFIPDGEWIDVFTGKTYVGPKTIKVQHDVESSPIFVKSGSVTALAEDMLNTNDKDWSSLALDWYPSTTTETSSILYEDDTKTVAYRDGKYRTTEYGTRYNKATGSVELYVNPAVGAFDGDRAFTTRNWKVRIHAPYGWGAPTSVKVNGETVQTTTYARDRFASPFEYTGASTDGDVYELSFTAHVGASSVVSVKFDSYEKEEVIVEDKAAFSVKTYAMDRTEGVDFTSSLFSDYVFYGSTDGAYGNGNVLTVRKPGVTNSGIGNMKFPSQLHGLNDNLPFKVDGIETNQYRYGAYSNMAGASWSNTVTVSGKGKIIVYVNGYNGKASMTVKDSESTVKTVSFLRGGNSYDRLEVYYDEVGAETFTFNFTRSDGNAAIAAIAIQPDLGIDYGFNVKKENLPAYVDLQSLGNQDWVHFNTDTSHPEKKTYRKNLAEGDRFISEFVGSGVDPATFYDYKATFHYADAVNPDGLTANISPWGTSTRTGSYEFTVKADSKTEYIRLYGVTWREALSIQVKDGDKLIYDGWPMWQENNKGLSGSGACIVIELDIPDGQTKTFTVSYNPDMGIGDHANAGITAVAVGYGNYADSPVTVVEKGEMQDYTGGDNLTSIGKKDWFHYGDKVNTGMKDGAYFSDVTGSDVITSAGLSEFKTLSWTNGDTTPSMIGKATLSTAKSGAQVALKLKANEVVNLKLYLGAIKATANLMIVDEAGNVLVRDKIVATDALYKTVNYAFKATADQQIRVLVISSDLTGGAVYLVAGALSTFECAAHEWDEGEITKETSCTEPGETLFTCVKCGATRTEEIKQLSHVFDNEVAEEKYLRSEATCKDAATYYYSCDCGEKSTTFFTRGEATGVHVFDQEFVSIDYEATPATCSAKATYYKSCECGEKGTETFEYGDFAEHKYDKQEVTDANKASDADCTKSATYYYVCSGCGAKGTETFGYGEPTAHVFADEHACHDRTCTKCNTVVEATEEHSWNAGEVTKEPTIGAVGKKTYTCTKCGETKVEDIDKLTDEEKSNSCVSVAPAGGNMGGGMAAFILTAFAAAAILMLGKRRSSKN